MHNPDVQVNLLVGANQSTRPVSRKFYASETEQFPENFKVMCYQTKQVAKRLTLRGKFKCVILAA